MRPTWCKIILTCTGILSLVSFVLNRMRPENIEEGPINIESRLSYHVNKYEDI